MHNNNLHLAAGILFLGTNFVLGSLTLGIETITPLVVQQYGLHTKKVGLITNQTGKDQKGNPSIVVLRNQGIMVTTIFAPEHGYTGVVEAGHTVDNQVDPLTTIPIISLYSHQKGPVDRTINSEKLSDIDVLIFDMQDSGMRHYTYISTLMRCLEAAASYNKQIFVLDRPNFLGALMEGPLVDDDLISFISIAPIPLRHGMTIGELALYFNTHVLKKPAALHVIPMKNYIRCDRETILPFLAPLSPNLPTKQACYGYSFLGLLGEIRPFDVGIGTPHAFQCILLPKSINVPACIWPMVQKLLLQHGVQSKPYTTFNKRKNEDYKGLLVLIPDIQVVQSFRLLLDLLSLFQQQGVVLSFASTFDKAVGCHKVRTALLNGATETDALYKAYKAPLQAFYTKAQKTFLYKPYPRIVY